MKLLYNALIYTQDPLHPTESAILIDRERIVAVGEPNKSYIIQATGSLSAPIAWSNIGSMATDAIGILDFTDNAALPRRFYRLLVP